MNKIVGILAIFLALLTIDGVARTPAADFFEELETLCGSRFVGEMTFPLEGQDSFKDKILVAEIAECAEKQLKIPFSVGDDKSRTWIVSRIDAGLRLKHKHLLKDGTVDPVSNYGGDTLEPGTILSQSFPADDYTKALIPEAASNVWTLSLSEDLTTLTYHLERHGKARFTAVLRIDAQR